MVAPLPMLPAIIVNWEAENGSTIPWRLSAIALVVLTAVFFEAFKRETSKGAAVTFLIASAVCLTLNVQNALNNAAESSDRRSDHRGDAMVAAQKASSQRSQWSHSRNEQSQIAGEATAASIDADIQQLISRDSKRWQATEECDPLKITAGASRELCAAIADLRKRAAAAAKRDELDAKIDALDQKTEGKEVPTSSDPYADNIADLLSVFGVVLNDAQKKIVRRSKDWGKTIGLELIAALGPSAILSLMLPGATSARRKEKPAKETQKAASAENIGDAPASAGTQEAIPLDDPFHLFIAECIEQQDGAALPAGVPWAKWMKFCADRGFDPGSQKKFGTTMKSRFSHDRNNNRPRYLNIKVKSPPSIRLAVSNS